MFCFDVFCGEAGGFCDSLLAGLGAFGTGYPLKDIAFGSAVEGIEVFYGGWVGDEDGLEVGGDDEGFDVIEKCPRTVVLGGGDFRESGRLDLVLGEETFNALFVDFGPNAFGFAWGDELAVAFVIEGLCFAVYPTVAEAFFDDFVVGDSGFAGAFFPVDEPDSGGGVVVLC